MITRVHITVAMVTGRVISRISREVYDKVIRGCPSSYTLWICNIARDLVNGDIDVDSACLGTDNEDFLLYVRNLLTSRGFK